MRKTFFNILTAALFLSLPALAEENWIQEDILIDRPSQENPSNAVGFTVQYVQDAKGDFTQFSAFTKKGTSAQPYYENRTIKEGVLVFEGQDLDLDLKKIYIQLNENKTYYLTTEDFQGKRKRSKGYLLGSLQSQNEFSLDNEKNRLRDQLRSSMTEQCFVSNTRIDVPLESLSRTVLFAATVYDIPMDLFLGLLYQENKFKAHDSNGDIRGIAQVSKNYAVADVENDYKNSNNFKNRLSQFGDGINPTARYYHRFDHNLLYSAAYLRHIYNKFETLMPSLSETERWKFVIASYNAGYSKIFNAWKSAGRPRTWNKRFVNIIISGEDSFEKQEEVEQYTGSIYFYHQQIQNNETDLKVYTGDAVQRTPAQNERFGFIRSFNLGK